MKRLLILLAILLPLVAAAQGKLYNQYAECSDLTVAQVSGFRLNDSVRIDVVLLSADTEEAWQKLRSELDIRDESGVSSWIAMPDNPSFRTKWKGTPALRVVVSCTRHTVGMYSIENETQYDALLDYQLNYMEGKKAPHSR